MAAVVAIIRYQDRILIGKKKTGSVKFLAGEWHIPGETVQANESDEEALKRGMKEETGLDITVGKLIGESITPTSKSNSRWYECFAYTDKASPGSDLEKLMWIYWKTVPNVVSMKSITLWPKEVSKYFNND